MADLNKIATGNPKSKTAIHSEYKAALHQVIDLLSAASPALRVTEPLSDVNAASSMASYRH